MLPERVRRLPAPPVPPVLPEGAEDGPEALLAPTPPPLPTLGAWVTAATGSGASPQVSQYPSWIVPPQPGRAHLVAVVVIAAPVR
jgi:hypothetical protein